MTGLTLTDEGGRIAALVIREHEPRPFGCSCGAQIGDDIDLRWHLVNQAIAAALEAAARTAHPASTQQIECSCYKLAPHALAYGEHHPHCTNHPFAGVGGRYRLAWLSAVRRARTARFIAIDLVDKVCPHKPDAHAEGTCEVCDYAFALTAAIQEGGE